MVFEEWSLTVGEVTAPFGIRGEVKVRLQTDFPDRFARCKQLCLRWPSGEARLFDVEGARLHKGQVLLRLRGITSIEDVDTLRDTLVQVRRTDAVRLPADEHYIHDLIGCQVEMPDGRVLGPLTDVMRGTMQDVYVIGEGKEEILLPAVKDVVQSIDLVSRKIVVTPTPGLLPEEQTPNAD